MSTSTPMDSIKALSAKELIECDTPQPGWIIDDFILERGITIIGGPTASLKSMISLHAALTSCFEIEFFGRQANKVPIVYLDAENNTGVEKDRLSKLANGLSLFKDIQEKDPQLYFVNYSNFKFVKSCRQLFEEEIVKKYKAKLIVVDTFTRFFVGEANESKHINQFYEFLKYFCDKYGTSWLILHHTRKGNQAHKNIDDLRGSSDIAAFADIVFILEKHSNNFVKLSQVKNRHSEPIENISVRLISTTDESLSLQLDSTKTQKGRENNVKKKKEKCAEEIQNWAKLCNQKVFQSKEIENEFENSNFKKNCIYDALKALVASGFFKKETKGTYTLQV